MSLNDEEMKLFIKECEEAFIKYDTNQNGKIEFHELGDLMKELADNIDINPPTYNDVANIMNIGDLNQDTVISKDEFVELYKIIYIMKRKLYETKNNK